MKVTDISPDQTESGEPLESVMSDETLDLVSIFDRAMVDVIYQLVHDIAQQRMAETGQGGGTIKIDDDDVRRAASMMIGVMEELPLKIQLPEGLKEIIQKKTAI